VPQEGQWWTGVHKKKSLPQYAEYQPLLFLFTYTDRHDFWLTPSNWVLLYKLTVPQLLHSMQTEGSSPKKVPPSICWISTPSLPIYLHGQTWFLTDSKQLSSSLQANSSSAPSFYANRRFITVFTTARHFFLSSTIWVQFTAFHPTSLRFTLILFSHLRSCPSSSLFLQTVCSFLSNACHMPRSSQPPWSW